MSIIAPSPPITQSFFFSQPLLVPLRPNAHRVRRSVLKQRIRPRHRVWIVRIRRGVNRVAARRRDQPKILRPVDKRRRRDEHAQRRRLAAARATPRAAHIKERAVAKHHVRQHLVVDVLFRSRADLFEMLELALDQRHVLIGLLDHLERLIVADLHAFRAALAFRRVDEDPKEPRLFLLLLIDIVILAGPSPIGLDLRAEASGRHRRHAALHLSFPEGPSREFLRYPEAFGHAVHAPHAVFRNKLRNLGSNEGEVARRAGGSRDRRPSRIDIGLQLNVAHSLLIERNNAAHKILNVDDLVSVRRQFSGRHRHDERPFPDVSYMIETNPFPVPMRHLASSIQNPFQKLHDVSFASLTMP